jgi:hypothetical protein
MRHLEQQKHTEAASAENVNNNSGDVLPRIKDRTMSLMSLLKQTRFSESDAGSPSAIQRHFTRRASSVELSGKMSKKSSSNFFECVDDDNTRNNYRQAIRGNTQSFLSLYDSVDQVKKYPSSNWLKALNPAIFRESDFNTSSGSLLRRASSKRASQSSADESFEFIDIEDEDSTFGCIDKDDEEDEGAHWSMRQCSQGNMPVRGCDLSQSLEQIESKLNKPLKRDTSVTTTTSNDNETTSTTNNQDDSHPQDNNESQQEEESCCEQQEAVDEDDERNNGCFEFCSEARRKAFERSGIIYGQRPSDIANQPKEPNHGSTLLLCWKGNAESSLNVHWNESRR